MALWLCMLLLLSMTCSNVLADEPASAASEETADSKTGSGRNKESVATPSEATESEEPKTEKPTESEELKTEEPAESGKDTQTNSVQNDPEVKQDEPDTILADVPMAISESPSREVTLYTKSDALEGEWEAETVQLTENGCLPDTVEEPERYGWKFLGWYDKEVSENYWGDDSNETLDALIKKYGDKEINWYNPAKGEFQKIKAGKAGDPGMEVHYCEQAMHTWLIESEGTKVDTDKPLDEGVTELYAMYGPRYGDIVWHYNGWKNQFNSALTSTREYQAIAAPLILSDWEGHTLEGWFTEPEGGEKLEQDVEMEGGYLCGRVGTGVLEPEMKGNNSWEPIHLYAHWSGGQETKGIWLSAYPSKLDPNKPGASVVVNLKLGTSGANWPDSVEWSVDRQDMGITLEPFKGNESNRPVQRVTLKFWSGILGNDNTTITVTAKTDKGLTASATITLCHDWYRQSGYEATCESTGFQLWKCGDCLQEKRITIPAKGHSKVTKNVAPTCTESGYQEITCRDCNKIDEKVITSAPLGHKWGSEIVSQSCGGTTIIRTCDVCGYTMTETNGNARHNWAAEPTVDKAPTCATDGSQSIHCLNSGCGAVKDSTVLHADPSLHEWSKWYTRRQATENQDGENYRICSECNLTETVTVKYIPPVQVDTWETPSAEEVPKEEGNSSGSSSSRPSGGSGGSGGGGGGGGGGGSSNAKTGQSAAPNAAPAPTVVPGSGGAITQVVNVTANAAAAAGVANAQVTSGAWQQDAQGKWILRYSDGTVAANSWICVAEADGAHWYHFGGTGIMDTGWLNVDGKVYYLEANPVGNGRMLTGWQMLNGKWYYFSTASDATVGSLLTNTTTPDGYKVNALGEWIQ